MNKRILIELINQGENSTIEFKTADVHPESLAKEIVAFANGLGGSILLGIDDEKNICGLNTNFNTEEWCMNIARNNVIPSINIEYTEIDMGEHKVAIVTVPRGKDKPYQTRDFKYLVRIGSTNRVASVNELMRLFQQSGAYHFDTTQVENSSLRSINMAQVSKYFESYAVNFEMLSEDEKIRILVNTDIMTEDNTLTIAGLLIFGINPQKYLPMASISFAYFNGKELDVELLDKQNIEGVLPQQIDTCSSIIKNHIKNPSIIEGNKRISTTTELPDKIIRELIVNACCHRNYSISGSRIRVFLFQDRLEVISPGRLPNSVTIEKLKAGVSYAVNPAIVKFMENLAYIDKLGRGLPMVYQWATKNNKKVSFEEIGEEFKVTLFLEPEI